MQPSIDVADAIEDMPTVELRLRAFECLCNSARRLDGIAQTAALQLNAEVTTLLRQRGVDPFTAVVVLA